LVYTHLSDKDEYSVRGTGAADEPFILTNSDGTDFRRQEVLHSTVRLTASYRPERRYAGGLGPRLIARSQPADQRAAGVDDAPVAGEAALRGGVVTTRVSVVT
jgi:hypothetical protein